MYSRYMKEDAVVIMTLMSLLPARKPFSGHVPFQIKSKPPHMAQQALHLLAPILSPQILPHSLFALAIPYDRQLPELLFNSSVLWGFLGLESPPPF